MIVGVIYFNYQNKIRQTCHNSVSFALLIKSLTPISRTRYVSQLKSFVWSPPLSKYIMGKQLYSHFKFKSIPKPLIKTETKQTFTEFSSELNKTVILLQYNWKFCLCKLHIYERKVYNAHHFLLRLYRRLSKSRHIALHIN